MVVRPRLAALLAELRPLTLVVAPGGFGKTTLVSAWLQTLAMPHVWLTLDKGDSDPAVFLRYLFAALQELAPGVGGDTLAPQLRIPLAPAFGQRLLARFGTPDMVDNTAFLNYFKGLLIGVDNPGQLPGQGGILYLNLLLAESKVTLYYRNTLPGVEDTLRFDLLINENCVRYTVMEHGHAGAVEPGLPEALADSTLGSTCYLQALGGLRTRIALPHILDYPAAQLRALAKAELLVPLKGMAPDAMPPSNTLFVFRRNEAGEDLLVPDQLTAGLNVGGQLDKDAGVYRFVITRYVQNLLDAGYANTGLSLVPGNGGVSVDRTVVGGPQDVEDPMKLVLTFTTY